MALTESQLAMWKTVVALVHADGQVHTEEDKFLQDRFEKLALTPEQKQELSKQIDSPGDPRELFKGISEPGDRSQLIYFARLLFFSDEDFSNQEQRILELLQSDVMEAADLTAAMRKADQVIVDFQESERQRKEQQPLHRKIINAIVFWEDLDTPD